jgi:hypothetical protein
MLLARTGDRQKLFAGTDQCDVRDTLAALTDFDELRQADAAVQMDYYSQGVAHHGEVRENARRTEQRVAVARDDLYAAPGSDSSFEFLVEMDKGGWPVFEYVRSIAEYVRCIAHAAGVTLIDLSKGATALRA